jgi:hypothetical protein
MFIKDMVDLPSTTLGTQVNGTERMTGRPISMIGGFGWANLQRYAAQAANNLLKSLILAQIERWRHG